MATMKVIYTNGTSETVPVTMRATCKAEEHAIAEGWGSFTSAPVRMGAYAVYAAKRLAGATVEPFDQWLDTVEQIEQATTPTVKAGDDTNPTN